MQSLTIGDSTLHVERINANAGGLSIGDLNVFSGSPLILKGTPTFVSESPITLRGVTDQGNGHGFIKRGSGTLNLSTGTWNYSGPITLEAGTLALDRFGNQVENKLGGANGHLTILGGQLSISDNTNRNFATPVSIFTDTSISLPRSGNGAGVTATLGALTLDGREVELAANAGTTSGTARMRFTATEFTGGANRFQLDANGATGLELQLDGPWVRNNGATVHFDLISANTSIGANPFNFLGPDNATLPAVTVRSDGAIDFGLVNAGNETISRFTAYDAFPSDGGSDSGRFELQGDGALTQATEAYLIKAAATDTAQSLNLDGQTLTVAGHDGFSAHGGAILFTGTEAYSVTGGTLSSNGTELILHQFNTGGVTIGADLNVGSGGVTKTGDGGLTLTTAQTFSGDLTINQGTVHLSGEGAVTAADIVLAHTGTLDVSGANGGNYTLGSGQTLRGTGTVEMGANHLTLDGDIAPGFSAGTLNFTSTGGDLTFSEMATLTMEIFGFESRDYDQITFDGGTFVAGGILQLETIGFSPEMDQVGSILQLFNVTNNDFSGMFDDILGTDLGDGYSWDTSNLLVDGTISMVPEPAAYALLTGFGAVSLILLRRRRMR